jgi:HD-GYP domain-containing protein (c-di-GMP phosphodiesterase class II)
MARMNHNLSQLLTEQIAGPQTRQEKQLEIMLQICRAIGRILDPDELIGQVMTHVTAAFNADRSTLFLHDEQTHELWSKIAQGLSGAMKEIRIPDDHGIAGHVFQRHASLRIDDTFEHEQFNRKVAESTSYVPRSMMVVPICHRPQYYAGVIQVMHEKVGYFTDDDMALLEAIAVQVGVSLENARLYDAQRRQFHSFVKAFSAAIDARDPTTAIHSINVANYAMGIGAELGLGAGELEWLRVAGMLHDVGKIGTPEAILCKTGKLDPDEFEEMKRHASYTRDILGEIEFIEEFEAMEFIAAAHHEKLDGTGYPDGLTARQIPMKARILAVADIYHALTQDRQYRKGMDSHKAMIIIDSMTPHQLDQQCVNALKRFLAFAG